MVETNIDSGIFMAIQMAGIEALKHAKKNVARIQKIYHERRDIFVDGLNAIGWKTEKPRATFYVWTPVLKRQTSVTLTKVLLDNANVVVTPGNGFGLSGEGYVRMALTVDKARLQEAITRIRKVI